MKSFSCGREEKKNRFLDCVYQLRWMRMWRTMQDTNLLQIFYNCFPSNLQISLKKKWPLIPWEMTQKKGAITKMCHWVSLIKQECHFIRFIRNKLIYIFIGIGQLFIVCDRNKLINLLVTCMRMLHWIAYGMKMANKKIFKTGTFCQPENSFLLKPVLLPTLCATISILELFVANVCPFFSFN